jgi:hypothetical protein
VPSWERRALWIILAIAFALRLGMVLELRGDVLFEHPPLDEGGYVLLATGQAPDDHLAYWQPPGLLYVLSATLVAGGGLLIPHLVQVLVGTACCLLLYWIGKRLFSARVGLAAAGVLAVHGVLVFESYELLPAVWMTFFDLLAVHLVLVAREKRSWRLALAAGLAIGVSAIFGPTILPFVLVAIVVLREPRAIAALAIGVVLPIAPVTVRNARRGELALVASNGPINFYVGNNADYDHTFAIRPGAHWEELMARPSGELVDDSIAFWRDHPGSALALSARKLYLFWNGAEIARDTDIYAVREESSILRALVAPRGLPFPDGLVIPLALLGMVISRREWRRLGIAYGFIAAQAIVIPIFFVSSRHRVPVLPMFALFAAAALAWTWTRWRTWSTGRRCAAAAALAALVIACNLPTAESRLAFPGELDYYRAREWNQLHEPDRALAAITRAIEAKPDDARFWIVRATVLLNLDRPSEAAAAYQRATELDPWHVQAARHLADIRVRLGDQRGAVRALEATIAAARRTPDTYAPVHLSLVMLHAKLGDTNRAMAALLAARLADPEGATHMLPSLTDALLAQPPAVGPAFWDLLAQTNVSAGDITRGASVRAHGLPRAVTPANTAADRR